MPPILDSHNLNIMILWYIVCNVKCLRIISSTERLKGDAEDVPAENPAERERSPAAERGGGVS